MTATRASPANEHPTAMATLGLSVCLFGGLVDGDAVGVVGRTQFVTVEE